ncbi:MAG: leucine-rich repeat domain-containing protein, partial [Cyanobacteria bacterium P01_C01_bin.89]
MTQDELLELLERAKAEGWTVVTEAEEFDQSSLEELEWWAFLREMLERWGVPPGEEDSLENCLQWIDRQEQLFLSETLPPTEVMPRAVAENWRALDLAGRELETLPPELFELQQLEILILGKWDNKTAKYKGNNLTSLPPEIGQLSSLTQLDLSSNQLSSLPPEIGQLSSLTQLYLRSNQLSSLPPEIGQ